MQRLEIESTLDYSCIIKSLTTVEVRITDTEHLLKVDCPEIMES